MIRFDLLFHLRFDLFEIVRRDAVWKIDIVIKTILHGRPGSELRFRPNLQNRRCEYMRRGVTQPLDVRHRRAFF